MIFYYASQIRNVSIFYIVLRMSCVESYYQEHEHACAYYHTVPGTTLHDLQLLVATGVVVRARFYD